MTPRLFDAIRKRHTRRLGREELLVGLIAREVVNYSMGAPKAARQAEDYVWSDPALRTPPPPPKKPQTVQQQFDIFERYCRNVMLSQTRTR